MKISFTKMQGLGNDFIIIDYIENMDYSKLSKKMCDRHFGIGADGLIVINPKDMQNSNTDCAWYIYNSDGTQAQMCGNGIRCFAKYMYENKFITKNKFKINTLAGIIEVEILKNDKIRVNMGKPILEKEKIPFIGKETSNFPIVIDNTCFSANAISMGNPHCVIFTNENIYTLSEIFGKEIEHNKLFPEKTNVEFVKIISKSKIEISVWERGCGITLACGTGSCASVAAGILNNLLDENVEVKLPGGILNIEWSKDKNSPIFMTGNAEFSFIGEYTYKK